ncbi:hypothetical protein SCA6_017562 [Theobroma cacao]
MVIVLVLITEPAWLFSKSGMKTENSQCFQKFHPSMDSVKESTRKSQHCKREAPSYQLKNIYLQKLTSTKVAHREARIKPKGIKRPMIHSKTQDSGCDEIKRNPNNKTLKDQQSSHNNLSAKNSLYKRSRKDHTRSAQDGLKTKTQGRRAELAYTAKNRKNIQEIHINRRWNLSTTFCTEDVFWGGEAEPDGADCSLVGIMSVGCRVLDFSRTGEMSREKAPVLIPSAIRVAMYHLSYTQIKLKGGLFCLLCLILYHYRVRRGYKKV